VFAPTADGMQKMPVYVDAVKWDRLSGLEMHGHNVQK